MSPSEKAKALYEAMYYKTPHVASEKRKDETSKACAIICVDEIIGSYDELKYFDKSLWKPINEYWQQVKSEIEKL